MFCANSARSVPQTGGVNPKGINIFGAAFCFSCLLFEQTNGDCTDFWHFPLVLCVKLHQRVWSCQRVGGVYLFLTCRRRHMSEMQKYNEWSEVFFKVAESSKLLETGIAASHASSAVNKLRLDDSSGAQVKMPNSKNFLWQRSMQLWILLPLPLQLSLFVFHTNSSGTFTSEVMQTSTFWFSPQENGVQISLLHCWKTWSGIRTSESLCHKSRGPSATALEKVVSYAGVKIAACINNKYFRSQEVHKECSTAKVSFTRRERGRREGGGGEASAVKPRSSAGWQPAHPGHPDK